MPKRDKRHRKKHLTYTEKFFFVVSLLGTFFLSLLVTLFLGKKTKPMQPLEYKSTQYKGSAVRKETPLRQNYEKYYRKKQSTWEKDYKKILENKEEVKKLKKLELTDTGKNNNLC